MLTGYTLRKKEVRRVSILQAGSGQNSNTISIQREGSNRKMKLSERSIE